MGKGKGNGPKYSRVIVKFLNGSAKIYSLKASTAAIAIIKMSGEYQSITYKDENGKIHRDDDLPAIEFSYGEKHWMYRGELHREGDKPASITPTEEQWYIHGVLDREPGKPAVVYRSGAKTFYVKGVQYNPNGPSYMDKTCQIFTDDKGNQHRERGLPSTEHFLEKDKDYNEYYVHGKKHRLDGRACRRRSWDTGYYINGHEIEVPNGKAFTDYVRNLFKIPCCVP
jgi:hypothetical protein